MHGRVGASHSHPLSPITYASLTTNSLRAAAAGAGARRGPGGLGARDFRKRFIEAALHVGEGHDQERAPVSAREKNFVGVAGVEARQGLVDVAEVHDGLAFRVHLFRYSVFGIQVGLESCSFFWWFVGGPLRRVAYTVV